MLLCEDHVLCELHKYLLSAFTTVITLLSLTTIVEELVPVGPLFKDLVQPIILTKSDCTLC